MSCEDCERLRELTKQQYRVITSLTGSKKTSLDLIETMSKALARTAFKESEEGGK